MALSRARYDDNVIPYARRSSILEEIAFQEFRRSFAEPEDGRRHSVRRQSSIFNRLGHQPIKSNREDDLVETSKENVFDDLAEEEEEEFVQDDFEDLPAPERPNLLAQLSRKVRGKVIDILRAKRRIGGIVLGIILAALYFAYFGYAMYVERLRNSASIRLLWVTCAVTFFVIIYFVKRFKGEAIDKKVKKVNAAIRMFNKKRKGYPLLVTMIVLALFFLAGLITILVEMVAKKDPYNLMSLLGIFVLLLMGYLGSTNPDRIRWRPVLTGLLMQFGLALLILKTAPGYEIFKFIGDRVSEFLSHTNAGSSFLFDIPTVLVMSNFAFRVLPIIIFFSTIISVLYYIGLMQMVISKVSWFMQMVMGTTAGESLNAAGNIFVGMTEAPLMIRPFIGKMTNSELHAVMTGGFATIAGSVLGAYIQFGVPANHLITASVMSAPAALAISKLFHPETKKSKTRASDVEKMEKSPYGNLIEAASGGALASIQLVANIAVSLIAFLALLEFVNQTLTWFGSRAGMTEKLTFQFICSYILWPLAFVMGVELADCRRVGELIGVKTFLNEYLAYTQLASIIKNRNAFNNLVKVQNITNPLIVERGMDFFVPQLNKTFEGGFFRSDRSEVIATYSLCGFSNIGAIGIMLGGLSALAPHRTKDLSSIVVRAMIAGNVACFLTACIAGLFYDPVLK